MKKFLHLLIFLVFGTTCFANPASALEKELRNIHSVTANFTQTVTNPKSTIKQVTQGNTAWEQPNQFIWHVKTPVNQLIMSNGKQLWLYQADLKQVTQQKLSHSLNNTPLQVITQPHPHLVSQFLIHEGVNKNATVFTLIPKNDQSQFKTVTLTFFNHMLTHMTLINSLNQTVSIDFSNIKTQVHFPKNTFEFKTPKGVDVVRA